MFNGPFEALREIEKLKKEIGVLNVQCYGYRETLKKYGFRRNFDAALVIEEKDNEIKSLLSQIKELKSASIDHINI
ncbi:hypothetical protein Ciccas_010792 [Cichlidogyrus casuarinus]|uniref:Uncharacterized protein n=1 Tax=Cichlidogyrus casuarinus TaxID=1844966 RepID=A0ABD2PT83_9PLAT